MPAPTAVVKNCDMPEDMMKGAPPPATLCAVCCALAERMWVAWMCAEAIEFAMEAQVTYNTDKEVAQAVRNRFVKKVCGGAGRSSPVCCAPRCRAFPITAHTTALEPLSHARHLRATPSQYNGVWHCAVGSNFGAYTTYEEKHFCYFYAGQQAVLLFKTG